jgi:hypothetical protein
LENPVKYTTTDIIKFLADLSGTDKIESDSDIFQDIGMNGDDFHEMIEKFSKQFSVDMKDYLWYFHCDEEGQSIGGTFFKPPYLRVKRIPVTPLMLTEFANNRKWNIIYPEHKLPKSRYDILINQILLGLFLAGIIIWAIVKWII